MRVSRRSAASTRARPVKRTGRAPNRALSRAEAPSDTAPITAAVGIRPSPDAAALYPRTRCMYSVISTWKPNAAAITRTCATFVPDTSRAAKIRRGSSGAAAVACLTAKPASRTAAAAASTSVRAEPQPCSAVPTSASTASMRPAVTSTAPAASMVSRWLAAACSGGSSRMAANPLTRAIGRFTKKIQCQLAASVMTPPSTRPMEAPPAPTKLYAPIARARSRGSSKSATIMPRLTAVTIAPPTPCAKRAPISMPGSVDRPQASEASANTTSPIRNTRRRPSRSPSFPASRSRPPNAMR